MVVVVAMGRWGAMGRWRKNRWVLLNYNN
jgi:hypothetical protein